MNVIILAGGRGTRLAGIWDRPKCLVPISGQPLLILLLNQLLTLSPQQIILALGVHSQEVCGWMQTATHPLLPKIIVHAEHPSKLLGTAGVIRSCAARLQEEHSTLVLNGDTVPLDYSLLKLYTAYERNRCDSLAAWSFKAYAGALVMGDLLKAQILQSEEPDLDSFIEPVQRYAPVKFLDIGTPEGFAEAQRRFPS